MKILEISRYKESFADHQLPFVTEQGQSLQAAGCEVDYFLVEGNYLTAVRALKTKIREFQPDIVHAHYGLSGITASLAVLSLRLSSSFSFSSSAPALVTTFHNGEWHRPWVNFLSSLFARVADHLIYVAPHIREKMYFKHPHYTILPCGVNMEESKPTPYEQARAQLGFNPDTFYILFGGAFSNTRKNVSLLRDALDLMGKRSIDEDWWQIDGDWCYKKVCVIEMRGMDRPTVALYMSACDLFALPSKSEGSPQALKEAMACGCPCLATDIADVRLLLGGLDGNYICSFDPTDVARGVEQLLSLPRGYRTQGRERIEELGYRNEDVAATLMEIYQGLRK